VMPTIAQRAPRFRANFVSVFLFALIFLSGCTGLVSPGSSQPPGSSAVAVSVSPTTSSIQVSKTQDFAAAVANDTQNKGVTWTLSGTGCNGAGCGTLSATSSASGATMTYTAPTAAPATVTLTATSVADATKSAAAAITVTMQPVIAVTVSPATANVQVGAGKQSFTATVQNDSQDKGVTWSLSGAGCSGNTCGSLSATATASGATITYTAPTTVPSPATVTLRATSVADTSKSAAVTIAITSQPVVAVTVAPTAAVVQAGGGTRNFSVTVQNDAQNKGVKWALSGAGCSGNTCGSLSATSSASGAAITYTAPANAPNPAAVTLTATSLADGTKSAAAAMTVTAPPVIVLSVTISPTTASVQASGGTNNFVATVQNDPQNKGVIWSLSGAGCTGAACGSLSATASASGARITYTAPATSPTPGTVTLTATSVSSGTKSAQAAITVVAPPTGVSVTLTPKRGGLTVSQSLTFTSTIANDVGGAGVTWSASAGSFSSQSSTSAVYVAPATPGVVTVTATSSADVTKSASATIGVTDLAGVVTYHNDLSRDGANTQEYALTTANVAPATFAKLFSCAIDSPAYAQPLWVANLTIGGGTHNAIFAASSRDTVYAFDADARPCVTYWSKQLLASGETFLSNNDVGTTDIFTDVGIVGSPVIDPSTKTLYVVSKSKNQGTNCSPSSACHQRLHALSLIDGSEQFNGPVDITSSITVPGTGDGSSGGNVAFNPLKQNQRPGLVLVNGIVYVAWASHGDNDPYHGWVMGFNASNLAQAPAVFNDSPNGSRSGIWMGGGAPAVDSANNLYVITGNGTYDGTTKSDFGDSFLKLSTSSGIAIADWFTPADQASLEGNDADFGSGGAAILVDQPSAPVPHLVIGGGKEGTLFLLNRDNLGHNNSTNQVVQTLSFGNGIFATAAFWNNALYLAGVGGPVKTFSFNTTTGLFNTSPSSHSSNSFGFPGSTPSVSASGTSGGIVWAIDNSAYGTPCCSNGPAVLHAYDATNLGTELWNSSQGLGNTAGNAVKFTVPTVANGKVYVGTRSEIDVFGLLPN
jgi:hypothetical protein